MVSNGENIFQKTQKYKKHVEKARGIGAKLGMHISTSKYQSALPKFRFALQECGLAPCLAKACLPYFVFLGTSRVRFDSVFRSKKKKKGFANKVSQNLHGLLNWGI